MYVNYTIAALKKNCDIDRRVEYIITYVQYSSLPDKEKPNWHFHKIEFSPTKADSMFPELREIQANAIEHMSINILNLLFDSY